MRVLIIDVNCKQGSTGKIAYDTYEYLNSVAGNEAAVCYGRGQIIKEKNIYKFGIDVETVMHALLSRITGLTGCFSFFSTKRLIKYIKRFDPDIVHIHELHAYFVNVKTLLSFLGNYKAKVIHTTHCDFSFTGKCGSAFNCEKWKTICSNCPHKRDYIKSLFFDFSKHMFLEKSKVFNKMENMYITTPSEWLSERVKQSYLKKFPIYTIHNGVNNNFRFISDFSILKKYDIPNKKIVLSVGSNIDTIEKGGPVFKTLFDDESFDDCFFIMVGCKKRQRGKNYLLLEKTENVSELATLYSSASVFVLLSKTETFSLTCAESLCCGTPIVGFRCGAPEKVFFGKYSIFVDYGDIDSLKQSIRTMLNNAFSKKDVSCYGRANFSNEIMLKKYYLLYQSVMKSDGESYVG